MSDTVKLIVEIPKEDYEFTKGAKTARYFPSEYYVKLILNGIPLDSVIEEYVERGAITENMRMLYKIDLIKAEIANLDRHKDKYSSAFNRPDLIDLVVDDVLQILDRIDKAESEE